MEADSTCACPCQCKDGSRPIVDENGKCPCPGGNEGGTDGDNGGETGDCSESKIGIDG